MAKTPPKPPAKGSSRPVQVTVTRGPAAAAEMAQMERDAGKQKSAAKGKGR